MALFIHGVLFQVGDYQALLKRLEEEPPEAVAVDPEAGKPCIHRFVFTGQIVMHKGVLIGSMSGDFGEGEISDVELDKTHFNFQVRHYDGDKHFSYSFTQKDELSWLGRWSVRVGADKKSPEIGKGVGRCLVTEVPDSFFQPLPVLVALKEKRA